MTLPAIELPKIVLPFDIPVLLHPAVDHFVVALPVVILLLELINLVMKKKAVGGVSVFLIFLTIIVSAVAYLTGLTDGKEAYPALGEAAKAALLDHKLLGTYLMLASVVVLFFKLLASLTGKGIFKALYLLVLIAFVAGIFEQGKEGGELVYKYGLNVEQVKVLDDELFDVKEELEEAKEAAETVAETVKKELSKPAVVEAPVVQPSEPQTPVETTPIETIGEELPQAVETEMKKDESMPAVEEQTKVEQVTDIPVEVIPAESATH